MKTRYLWDPIEDNVIAEFDESNTLVVDYTTEPEHYGNVISQHRDETNVFYSDTLGSTVAVTNQLGSVVATRAYSDYGESTESTGNLVFPYQYLGEHGYYLDSSTETFYVRRRIYSSHRGRWLSGDPCFLEHECHSGLMSATLLSESDLSGNIVLFKSYDYVENRPLSFIDPSGLYRYRGDSGETGNICEIGPRSCIDLAMQAIDGILARRTDCFTPKGRDGCNDCRSALTDCVLSTIASGIEIKCDHADYRNGATYGDCARGKNKARAGQELTLKLDPDSSCHACPEGRLFNSYIVFSLHGSRTMPKFRGGCAVRNFVTHPDTMEDFVRTVIHELLHNCVGGHVDERRFVPDEHKRPDASTAADDFIRNCWTAAAATAAIGGGGGTSIGEQNQSQKR